MIPANRLRVVNLVYRLDIDSISLTEEWLLKFGFENNGIAFWNGVGLSKLSDGFYFMTTKIEFLHQLQTLYFALTGEELTIKS